MNERAEVIGTVRDPDGDPSGSIDGLVLPSPGGCEILPMADAINAAQRGLLWCRTPGGHQPVDLEPRDSDGDGRDDCVATKGDDTVTNNLHRLPILAVRSGTWLPWRGDPPPLTYAELWNFVTRTR